MPTFFVLVGLGDPKIFGLGRVVVFRVSRDPFISPDKSRLLHERKRA